MRERERKREREKINNRDSSTKPHETIPDLHLSLTILRVSLIFTKRDSNDVR